MWFSASPGLASTFTSYLTGFEPETCCTLDEFGEVLLKNVAILKAGERLLVCEGVCSAHAFHHLFCVDDGTSAGAPQAILGSLSRLFIGVSRSR